MCQAKFARSLGWAGTTGTRGISKAVGSCFTEAPKRMPRTVSEWKNLYEEELRGSVDCTDQCKADVQIAKTNCASLKVKMSGGDELDLTYFEVLDIEKTLCADLSLSTASPLQASLLPAAFLAAAAIAASLLF